MKKEDIIKKAIKIHGNKYDYSKVVDTVNHNKIKIICHEHGEFEQDLQSHLRGAGCPKCNVTVFDTDSFIKKAKAIWGDEYDYSKSIYEKSNKKLIVICKKHGQFEVTPNNHTHKNSPRGCPLCKNEKISKVRAYSTDFFISKLKQIYGNKYDYSKVEYVNNRTKVCLICNEHGEFWKTPSELYNGSGCPRCAEKCLNTDRFIKMARIVHGDKYDYSKVECEKWSDLICIICPKHGIFWQEAKSHLHGSGCPACTEPLLEKDIYGLLSKKHIRCVRQWQSKLSYPKRYDFYLPDYNIVIECQGIQHFKPIEYFGGEEAFKKQLIRDEFMFDKAKECGLSLIYYTKYKEYTDLKFYEDKLVFDFEGIEKYVEQINDGKMNVDKICEEIIWYSNVDEKTNKFRIPVVCDFDFTITKDSSWLKGTFTENDHCFEIMKRWQKDYGVVFILETMRGEKHIQPAIDFCKDNGIEFFGIGRNPLQGEGEELSCKCWGVFGIDDRNCGVPLICPEKGRPYVDWEKLDEYMSPIFEKINKRIYEVKDRVLEAKRMALEENKFVEIDYSY